ncbi:MAG: hypothetical protein AVDCRST_MAG54-4407, partial [uncultured Actinomycetospora sp.]
CRTPRRPRARPRAVGLRCARPPRWSPPGSASARCSCSWRPRSPSPARAATPGRAPPPPSSRRRTAGSSTVPTPRTSSTRAGSWAWACSPSACSTASCSRARRPWTGCAVPRPPRRAAGCAPDPPAAPCPAGGARSRAPSP